MSLRHGPHTLLPSPHKRVRFLTSKHLPVLTTTLLDAFTTLLQVLGLLTLISICLGVSLLVPSFALVLVPYAAFVGLVLFYTLHPTPTPEW